MSYELLTPSLPLQVGNRETGLPFVRRQATQDPKSQPGMHFSQQQPIRRLHFQVSPGKNNSQPALADPTRDFSCAGSQASVGWPTHLQKQLVSKLGTCLYILWTWNLFSVKWFGGYHNAQHFIKHRPRKASKYWMKSRNNSPVKQTR